MYIAHYTIIRKQESMTLREIKEVFQFQDDEVVGEGGVIGFTGLLKDFFKKRYKLP